MDQTNIINVDVEAVDEDTEAIYEELVHRHEKMVEDADKKLKMAKDQLVECLQVTAEKYKTATGVMVCGKKAKEVFDIFDYEPTNAAMLATEMSQLCLTMLKKAEKANYEKMEEIPMAYLKQDFAEHDFTSEELIRELLVIDLLQQVGPIFNDITEFKSKTDVELEELSDQITELAKEL